MFRKAINRQPVTPNQNNVELNKANERAIIIYLWSSIEYASLNAHLPFIVMFKSVLLQKRESSSS